MPPRAHFPDRLWLPLLGALLASAAPVAPLRAAGQDDRVVIACSGTKFREQKVRRSEARLESSL